MSAPGEDVSEGQREKDAPGLPAAGRQRARGGREDTAGYGQFSLRPDQVHKNDAVRVQGMWVTMLDEPAAGTDPQTGRRGILVYGRRPDTGATGVMTYEPDDAMTVRRARGSTQPKNLKIVSPDGAVTYRTVHDQDTADHVAADARAAGAAVADGEPFPADAPVSARHLHAHAIAHGWDTEWVPGGSGSGHLTAAHPDHHALTTSQEWQNGRKTTRPDRADGEYGPLGESREIISAVPGRIPGQSRGEITAEKLLYAAAYPRSVVDLDDGDLSAADAEFARRASLTAHPEAVQERHQAVRTEIGLRAAKNAPVEERTAPYAADARQLAADIRAAFPDGPRMAESTVAEPAPEMLDCAGTLDDAARHFDAQREREGVSALYEAKDDLKHRAYLMWKTSGHQGTAVSTAGQQGAAGDFAARAKKLHRTAADRLPLTDADGRQVRAGDTVELLDRGENGRRATVTRMDIRSAHLTSPYRIRLVARADGSEPEPSLPATQPGSDDPAAEARDLAACLRGTSWDARFRGNPGTGSALLEQAAAEFDRGNRQAGRRTAADVSRAMHRNAYYAFHRTYAARVLALSGARPGEQTGGPADAARQLATDIYASPHSYAGDHVRIVSFDIDAGPYAIARRLDTAAGHFNAGRGLLGAEKLEEGARLLSGAAADRAASLARMTEPGARKSFRDDDPAVVAAAVETLNGMARRARAILGTVPPARTGQQRLKVTGHPGRAEWHLVHDDAAHRAILENSARHGTNVAYDEDPPLAEAPKGARDLHGQAVASGWDVAYCRADPDTGPRHGITATSPDGRREVIHLWHGTTMTRGRRTLADSMQEIADHPRRPGCTPSRSKAVPQGSGTRSSRATPQRKRAPTNPGAAQSRSTTPG